MKIKTTRYVEDPTSNQVVTDSATTRPVALKEITGGDAIDSLPQWHPITGAELNQSGYNLVIAALEYAYGPEDDDVKGKHLDKFFEFYRHNKELIDYCIAFRMLI